MPNLKDNKECGISDIPMVPPSWAQPPKIKETDMLDRIEEENVKNVLPNNAEAKLPIVSETRLSNDETELLELYRAGKVQKPSNIVSKEDLSSMAFLEGKLEGLSQNVLKVSIDIVNAEKQRDTLVEQLNEMKTAHSNFMTQFSAKYGVYGKKWEIEPSTGAILLTGKEGK